jgi:SAM-dependent methyltransferase
VVTTQDARRWLARWDRQQEFYLPDREERFGVIADVLAAALDRPDPLVIDLGAGPGSLSARLLDRFPRAEVVAVDADPLLLGLARAAYGERPRLRIIEQDLRSTDWADALGLPRAPDAIVSTTALHWLAAPEVAALYERCGALLAAGGVLANGDHLFDTPARPRLAAIVRQLREDHADRSRAVESEDWATWWDAVAAAPELRDLTTRQEPRPIDHSQAEPPGLDEHIALLRRAGFAEVGTVWQYGDDRVLVALR